MGGGGGSGPHYDGKTETVSLCLDDAFDNAIFQIIKTAERKRADYASKAAPFSNFEFTANYFGLRIYQSADFNELQKLARLRELNQPGVEPTNEPVLDSYLDKAVFAVLAFAMYLQVYQEDC
jgi:hypothetical protein